MSLCLWKTSLDVGQYRSYRAPQAEDDWVDEMARSMMRPLSREALWMLFGTA